jgi:hypothetical protein
MMIAWALLLLPLGAAGAADPWESLDRAARDGDKASARATLEALLIEQPTFYAGHFNLGTLEMDSDPEAAATHLDIASASPQVALAADAAHNLALVRWKQGRLEDAVEAAQRACALRSEDADEQKLLRELRRALIVRADQARRTAEEEARKLHLAVHRLPDAHAREPYDVHIPAAGGHGAYRFSLGAAAVSKPPAGAAAPPSSPLPRGLELDSDGRLHGTPVAAGRYDLLVALVDADNHPISDTITLMVLPAPAILTSHLPEAVRSSPYHAELACEGLQAPRWSITGLPPGLTLSQQNGGTAVISGVAREKGTVTLHLSAADQQRHAERDLELSVTDLFAPTQAVLPPATAWALYEDRLSVLGPPQTYRWAASPQHGLTIAADGAVTGTPDQAGQQPLTATIQAEDGRSRTVTVTVPVNPPPVIEESHPIALTVGQPVERPLSIAGGTSPFHWSIADGVLPKGLRLDGDGSLRGACTVAGSAEVTIAVADRWQAATQQKITVTVAPAPSSQDQKTPNDHQDDRHQQDQAQQGKQGTNAQNRQPGQQDQAQQPGQQGQPDQHAGQRGNQDQGATHQDPAGHQQDHAQHPQQGQRGQPGQQDATASAQSGPADGAAASAGRDAAREAQLINQAAADRWIDQLPKENRAVLRYQLLEGGEAQPHYKGKTW